MKNKLRLYLFIFSITILSINTFSQNNFVASNDIFGRRVFIKNNGQFDGITAKNEKVEYGYVNGEERVFFDKTGLTYFIQKKTKMTHRQREKMEHGEKMTIKPSKKCFINVSWENSNSNIEIVESEIQSFYHSFGDAKLKSNCFKKITYKNVYDNIDIEYLFTDERQDGIKYNILLHPGANIDDIKIKYSGDFEKIFLKEGNLIIKTSIHSIKEIAPKSFQNGTNVLSNYEVNGNILSFKLPNGYDKTKELIIDPWVLNLALTTSNYGFDVDYDYSGNYYVYGGTGPFLTSKYSPSGVLLWTFGGEVPSESWTSLGSNPNEQYVGNFLVDKTSGKSYSGEGFNYDVGTRMVRIDQNGIYDNFISVGDPSWNEVWDMGFYCSDGSIFGLGGSITSNVSAGKLNTLDGNISPQNFTGESGLGQDIVSHAIDPFGNIFYLFASGGSFTINNCIMSVNATFNGNNWIVPTTYSSFIESQNKDYINSGLPMYSSNGFNALAANADFLYYYDGNNLAAYNKSTGAKIGFISISGQNIKEQGGIAVDDCNNVYIGGNGSIRCYFFNGTTFTSNGNIPVASTTTDKYVTDIKYFSGSNELYVCGSGFGGIYSAINSTTCSTIQMTVSTSCAGTNNGSAEATITTNIANPLVSFTWLNSNSVIVGQSNNQNSLTESINNLVNGNYTVMIQVNAPCGPVNVQSFTIDCACTLPPTTPGAISGPISICSGSSNTYSIAPVAGATSYSWILPSGFTGTSTTNSITTIAGLTGGTISVTAVNGCGTSSSSTVDVTVNLGPTTIAGSNSQLCEGDNLNLTATTSTIIGTMYSWTGPDFFTSNLQNPTIPSVTLSKAGQYTVTVSALGCTSTSQTDVIVKPNPTFIIGSNSPICEGEEIQLTASMTSNAGVIFSWSGPNSFQSNLQNDAIPISTISASGQYSLSATLNGCQSINNVTVLINPLPTLVITDPREECYPNRVNITDSEITTGSSVGSLTYWKDDLATIPLLSPSSLSESGVYYIKITSNNCETIAPVNVLVNPKPVAQFIPSPNVLTTLNPNTIMINNSTGADNYLWNFGDDTTSTLMNPEHYYSDKDSGTYYITLFAYSGSNCVDTAVFKLIVSDELIFYIPNTFTPDMDSHNQSFKPIFTSGFNKYSYNLLITNRWGEVVFESNDATVGWDGTYGMNGKQVQDGTYIWKIEFGLKMNDQRESVVGNVNVIR